MIRYMQEVYRRIRENNSAMLTDNNHLIYIATPSGWDKKPHRIYTCKWPNGQDYLLMD